MKLIKTRRLFMTFAFLLTIHAVAWAAAPEQRQPDQTIFIEGTPERAVIPAALCPKFDEIKKTCGEVLPPTGLEQAQIESILAELLPGKAPKDGVYYVLHLVRYEKGEAASRSDAWYAFTKSWSNPGVRSKINDPEIGDHFRQERLLGAKKLSFIYVHYGIPGDTITPQRVQESVAAERKAGLPPANSSSTDVDAERLKLYWDVFEQGNAGIAFTGDIPKPTFTAGTYAADRANSEKEIDRITKQFVARWVAEFRASGTRIKGPNGQALVPLSGPPSDSVYYIPDGFIPITYRIDILKKRPVWQDDLKTIASNFNLQSGVGSDVNVPLRETIALINISLDREINYPTSDIVVTGARGKATPPTVISTKTYDNERAYWFDLGFVVPFKSIEELKFNSDEQLVQAKPVEKNRLYATTALFPLGPVNTKADKLFRLAPAILYGISLDKKPWEHQLIGGAVGLKWVQPFVGLAGTRYKIPAADGTVSHHTWGWRLTYGLQISTRALASAIRGK